MESPTLTDALNRERVELEREIATLEPKQKRLALIVELLKLYPTAKRDAGPALIEVPPNTGSGALYAGLKLTDAVLKCLELKYPAPMLPREIRDALQAGGFKSDSDNVSPMIFNACTRLTESGRLEKSAKNGYAAYRLNKGPGNTGGNA